MSGLINKAKEALHSDKKDNAATDHPHSTNAGPHGSNVANKADPRVDSDRDNFGTTGTTGTGYSSTTHGTTGAGYGSTTHGTTGAGPHSSNLANKADPRVDSDRDGRGIGHGTTTTGTTGTGYGSSGATTGGYGNDPRSTNAGPHSSNLANKADPRVDSDRDGRGIGHGTTSTGTTGTGYGTSGATTGGYGSTTTGTTGAGYGASGPGNPHSTNAGPHRSNVANTADPRIDSDLDSNRRTGFGTSGTGHTGAEYAGTNPTSTTSAGYGSATTGSAGAAHHSGSSALPGSGNASNTAGPHNSNLLNKLDPRVDSDLDGSKTYGGNATHQ